MKTTQDMSKKYYFVVECQECGFEDDEVVYDPKKGTVIWECPSCHSTIDLFYRWQLAELYRLGIRCC